MLVAMLCGAAKGMQLVLPAALVVLGPGSDGIALWLAPSAGGRGTFAAGSGLKPAALAKRALALALTISSAVSGRCTTCGAVLQPHRASARGQGYQSCT